MTKALNFNTIKKNFLPVTLADENKTTLLVGTPTKAMIEDLTVLQDSLTNVNDDINDSESLNLMYEVIAKVMSRNKTGTKITADFLAEIMDIEDIMIFFSVYMDFVNELSGQKN